ncbi:hypothetical protein BX666DRAFT_938916 [Dichotomocladium elegans]|nr:hypothetical protein BX666DRAFT_938916 [Dichotomocladium elegans]
MQTSLSYECAQEHPREYATLFTPIMIKNTLSTRTISAAAEDVRLLFDDPPITMPGPHLPSFTAHALLQVEMGLVDAIDKNQNLGFISKASRWSSIVGLVILDSVGRALGIDQEIGVLAQNLRRQSQTAAPPLSFTSTSSATSSNSSNTNSSSSSSSRLIERPCSAMDTPTKDPMTGVKGSSPTVATVHMTPSRSTNNRARTATFEEHQCISQSPTSTRTDSSAAKPSDSTNTRAERLRRTDRQQKLVRFPSRISMAESPSLLPERSADVAAAVPPEPQSGTEEEYTHTINHHAHQRSILSPPTCKPSSPHQKGVPVPSAAVSPVIAFKRTSSAPRSVSLAGPSPIRPFRRTCCTLRSAHQQRPWHQ